MQERIPEQNKRAGVCYAWTDDGIELPLVDYTHPDFQIQVSEGELSALIDSMQRAAAIPPAALQAAAQKSILVRGMVESAGTYTTGMMTYLNKLPAAVLGDGYANALDRQWASGFTPLTFRWRMRDVARILADELALQLEAHPGQALQLLNIAGGPAFDSLNALLFLRKEHPALLTGRTIEVLVLDLDQDGPHFGARALAALAAPGGPLEGVTVLFHSQTYDWCDPARLAGLLPAWIRPGAVVIGSSEGGLFEYAGDDVIRANLRALHANTPGLFCMAGPVIRDASSLDPRLRGTENTPGRPAVRYLGLSAMGSIARESGWELARTLDGPMHQVMMLRKA